MFKNDIEKGIPEFAPPKIVHDCLRLIKEQDLNTIFEGKENSEYYGQVNFFKIILVALGSTEKVHNNNDEIIDELKTMLNEDFPTICKTPNF